MRVTVAIISYKVATLILLFHENSVRITEILDF